MAIDQDIKELEEMIKTEGLSGNKAYRSFRKALESALFVRFGWAVSGTLKYFYGGIFEVRVLSKSPLSALAHQENEQTRNAIIMLCKYVSINASEPLTPQIEEIALVQAALDKCREELINLASLPRDTKFKFTSPTYKDPSAPIASASKRGAPDDPQARQALERR